MPEAGEAAPRVQRSVLGPSLTERHRGRGASPEKGSGAAKGAEHSATGGSWGKRPAPYNSQQEAVGSARRYNGGRPRGDGLTQRQGRFGRVRGEALLPESGRAPAAQESGG